MAKTFNHFWVKSSRETQRPRPHGNSAAGTCIILGSGHGAMPGVGAVIIRDTQALFFYKSLRVIIPLGSNLRTLNRCNEHVPLIILSQKLLLLIRQVVGFSTTLRKYFTVISPF